MLSRLLTVACVVGFMSLVPMLADAQKVASYDFTDTKPLERLRPPLPPQPLKHPTTRDPSHPPPPPKPIPEEVGQGVCGGILGNPPILVSILSLDQDLYVFGDVFRFVLELKAVYPARVPVRASIVEIEPRDPSQSYKWREMLINMQLHDEKNKESGILLLHLYGSPDAPASEVSLKVGEWIEMRGKARMEWRNPRSGTAEGWFIRVPLQTAHQFSATAIEHRESSLFYDAKSRQEHRICDYPAEMSSGSTPIYFTVTPKLH